MEQVGPGAPLCAPVSSSQQRLLRRSSTYLAKIAVVLQLAPEKMLTFTQLMDDLTPLVSENRRSFENNIRVCLSTNKCFVKIPVVPDSLESKRNFWKLDSGQITAKMVRRHFKGLLQLFPELASKVGGGGGGQGTPKPPREPEVQKRLEGKFSGPFSIESLLRRDGPSPRTWAAPPPRGVRVGAERQPRIGPGGVFSWDPEGPLLLYLRAAAHQQSPVRPAGGATHRGLAADPPKRTHMHSEAPWRVPSRTSAAPCFTSPPSRPPLPAAAHDVLHFRL